MEGRRASGWGTAHPERRHRKSAYVCARAQHARVCGRRQGAINSPVQPSLERARLLIGAPTNLGATAKESSEYHTSHRLDAPPRAPAARTPFRSVTQSTRKLKHRKSKKKKSTSTMDAYVQQFVAFAGGEQNAAMVRAPIRVCYWEPAARMFLFTVCPFFKRACRDCVTACFPFAGARNPVHAGLTYMPAPPSARRARVCTKRPNGPFLN